MYSCEYIEKHMERGQHEPAAFKKKVKFRKKIRYSKLNQN